MANEAKKNRKAVKTLPNLVIYDDGCMLFKNVRLSYPHLFEKWSKSEGEQKRYSCKGLLDKTTHAAEIKAVGQHLVAMCMEAFKAKLKPDMLFMRDGAQEAKEEMENSWIISASDTKYAPNVLNRDKSRLNEDDDIIYAGCYVHILVHPWVQKNEYGKRINAHLLAVQFVKDGERFGSERPDTDDVFGDISGDFDDGDGDDAGGDSDDPFAD